MDKWYVYFFPERGPEEAAIKIGYSKHPLKRLKQLQTGHPTKIGCEGWIEFNSEEEARAQEEGMHAVFSKDRIRKNGEWFKYSDHIKDHLIKLRSWKEFTRYYY